MKAKIVQWADEPILETDDETGSWRHSVEHSQRIRSLWNLLDFVAEDVKIPKNEVNIRVDRLLRHFKPPSIFLAAKIDNLVVGICVAEVGNTANTAHVGWLRMDVHPDYRSQGIGTQLLERMIRLAQEQGLRRLEITSYEDNVRGRKFFQEAGFKTEGKHTMARRDPATGKFLNTYTLARLIQPKRK